MGTDEEDFFEDRLDDRGLVHSLATDPSLRDIPQNIRYIRSYMFDPLPERGGMNSTRIAEVLNFRRLLPPMVTVSHVHALIRSPTEVEREVAELTKAGVLRKTIIPGRGIGGSSVSDGLVLLSDLESLLRDTDGLEETVKGLPYILCIANSTDPCAARAFSAMSQGPSDGIDVAHRAIFQLRLDRFNASGIPDIFVRCLINASEHICQFTCISFRNHDITHQHFPSSIRIRSRRRRRRRYPRRGKHRERQHRVFPHD